MRTQAAFDSSFGLFLHAFASLFFSWNLKEKGGKRRRGGQRGSRNLGCLCLWQDQKAVAASLLISWAEYWCSVRLFFRHFLLEGEVLSPPKMCGSAEFLPHRHANKQKSNQWCFINESLFVSHTCHSRDWLRHRDKGVCKGNVYLAWCWTRIS